MGKDKIKAHKLACKWWIISKNLDGVCDSCCIKGLRRGQGYLCESGTVAIIIGDRIVDRSNSPDLLCEECFDSRSDAEPFRGKLPGEKWYHFIKFWINNDVSKLALEGEVEKKVLEEENKTLEEKKKILEEEIKNRSEKKEERLREIKDTNTVEPLIKAFREGESDIRAEATKRLGMLGDASAVELLTQALIDVNWHVRKVAAEALGNIGWQPNDDVERARYFIALGKSYELEKLEESALVQALDDKDRFAQEIVKKALENVRQKKTIN